MDHHTRSNQAVWDAWSAGDAHDSDHARDEALVRAGGSSLRGIELAELGGEVAGKSLLHLLCNRGSDTLSWARLGATVTGVDFSASTIARARTLAAETGLSARFLQSDLYALPDVLEETFDIVYASYGVLCWLPDLARWASTVARYLRPGGLCYLVEMHPASGLLAADATAPAGLRLRPDAAYFHTTAPHIEHVALPGVNIGRNGNVYPLPASGRGQGERSGKNGNSAHSSPDPMCSCAACRAASPTTQPPPHHHPNSSPPMGERPGEGSGKNGNAIPLAAAISQNPSPPQWGGAGVGSLATWPYSLGEVVTALIQAGLRLESLCEYPATFYRQFPTLVEGSDRLWRWPDPAITLPLLFSLRARR